MAANKVVFLLNNEQVSLENCDPNITVLQYLRNEKFKSGTKEGCAAGDCGACTVVVAELILDEKQTEQLHYKSINACITFIATLHGKQLITVEHLKEDGQLHHVQQALVNEHGSQCGFCTPGFVMSSFALHKQKSSPERAEVVEALAGNLCRCTGYRSIIAAVLTANDDEHQDSFSRHYQQTIQALKTINQQNNVELQGENRSFYAPSNVDELAEYLLMHPQANLVAGATDLALTVTQNLSEIDQLVYLGNVIELQQISESDSHFIIGAAVPYSVFAGKLVNCHQELLAMIERIGSLQIRNNGTLGGNIANASPIGDMPPALIALGGELTLQRGSQLRTVDIEDYFIAYKKTALAESEFIKEIYLPKLQPNQTLKLYKISKRIDDDISAVLAAIFIELDKGNVKQVRIAFGGMAAIPMRAKQCEQVLLAKPFNQENIEKAQQALALDFSPMSDVRASAQYRMKVAQNLLQKCFIEIQSPTIETRVVTHA